MGSQRGSQGIRSSRLALALMGALLSLPCVLGLYGLAGAGEVDSFRISQVCAIHPDFDVFVEVLDADGNMVKDVIKEQLTAVLGNQELKIKDSGVNDFSQSGEGVAYILLVDISKSLSEKEFSAMRQVLRGWIDDMGPKDQAALITFGTQVKTVQDFTNDKVLLNNLVAQLQPTDKDTQLHKGLIKAMELGSRADPDLPSRRVIITLSDGQDDYAGGATAQEVYQKMKVDPVPIYAIGYYRPPRKPQKEEALKNLGAFARTSGGSYFRAESNTIPDMFTRMKQRIMDVYRVEFMWPEGNWDGAPRHLQITYKEGPKIINAGLDMRLQTSIKKDIMVTDGVVPPQGGEQSSKDLPKKDSLWGKTSSFWANIYPWGYVGGGLLLVGLLTFIIIMASTQKGDRLPPQAPLPGRGPELEGSNPYQTVGTPPATTGRADLAGVWKPPGSRMGSTGKLVRLTVVRGAPDQPPYELKLRDRLVIGRSPDCDLPLTEDKEVSRQHCELILMDEVVRIADLGSKNGTLVNGVPISGTYQLQDDDIILVGKTELRVNLT